MRLGSVRRRIAPAGQVCSDGKALSPPDRSETISREYVSKSPLFRVCICSRVSEEENDRDEDSDLPLPPSSALAPRDACDHHPPPQSAFK